MRFVYLLMALVWLLTSCGAANPTSEDLTTANEMLRSINAARSSGVACDDKVMPPAPRLGVDALLVQAARLHSEDMLATNDLSHTGSDGSNPGQRIRRAGYQPATWGENAARGQRTVEQVVGSWLRSPGHCRNLMNPAFTEMGGARAGNFWTLVLARPR